MTTASPSVEGYIHGTDTRVNLLGITDAQELAEVEKQLFTQAIWQFATVPSPEEFTGDFLREIHRRGFDGLYSWAGQYKTVPTSQGNLPITHSSPEDTAADVNDLFADLAAENNLAGLDHGPFVTRLADYWARMTEIHPFADGNSRSQYELFRRIAENAGWEIDTARIDLAALAASRYVTAESGDPRLLADVLAPAVVPADGYTPTPLKPGRPVLSLTSHLAIMRDYDRDRSGPYTAPETFREVPRMRERPLRGVQLDNAHALVRLGLTLAERTNYGDAHDAAVHRILEGTSTFAAERAAAGLPEPNDRYKDLFDPLAGKTTMRYDTGAVVNAFDERDPARLHELVTWELALRTADYLAHREILGDGSELHASVVHRELHTDFMPIISDTAAYTEPKIPAADAQTIADPRQLGRHIAAIQEETEGIQSVAVLLVADQLAHRIPDRTIDWRVIDPEALRAATHAANFHDNPPDDADPDLALEDAMRTVGREAFAAELERAVTTELPTVVPGPGDLDPNLRYERHWEELAEYRSPKLQEGTLDQDDLLAPVTAPNLAPDGPERWTPADFSPEPEHDQITTHNNWSGQDELEQHQETLHRDTGIRNERAASVESQSPSAAPTQLHRPAQPDGRPPSTHDHHGPAQERHFGHEL
ncbi:MULTISPECIES: Fic family protein [unclassified Rhodococcus (in: high G+C Gram-positive bacteria)]|uniref:Fic/DOC family protein n=1 Tax=Rhodococcus sp. SJ-3 TaxID=3454628 RepID=UPI003F79B3DA